VYRHHGTHDKSYEQPKYNHSQSHHCQTTANLMGVTQMKCAVDLVCTASLYNYQFLTACIGASLFDPVYRCCPLPPCVSVLSFLTLPNCVALFNPVSQFLTLCILTYCLVRPNHICDLLQVLRKPVPWSGCRRLNRLPHQVSW